MKAINSELKLQIINELILNTVTVLQMSKTFGLSKQKTHYNYSLGAQMNGDLKMSNRRLINRMIEADNNINLTRTTANLLER